MDCCNAIFAPTFIQFISLALIICTFHFSKSEYFEKNKYGKYFIYILILCCPVFLFLVNSAKPQLISISCNFLAFFLSFIVLPKEKKLVNKKKIYLIIIFLTTLCKAKTLMRRRYYLEHQYQQLVQNFMYDFVCKCRLCHLNCNSVWTTVLFRCLDLGCDPTFQSRRTKSAPCVQGRALAVQKAALQPSQELCSSPPNVVAPTVRPGYKAAL